MPDGVRLAARMWLPQVADPVPSILEYIPYRKRDMVRARDERNHSFFASHGYACLRVDMRGSGDSEGTMPDMYAQNELDDARRVIEWIAAQDWCNGCVGMFGTSWGGTASLQAAVDAPEPLKAIIANCATINRFEDDIHWMGGCILTDTIEWAATIPAILATPPDSATVGDQWRKIWEGRLHDLTFPHEHWIRERHRAPYWKRGSVRFSANRLDCPVLAIGGWSDRYSNSVMPLVSARPDICRGIVGPWGHHYPDHGEPGPSISFQDVALDWWDHLLKSDAPKMPDWPALRLWQRDFDVPQDRLEHRNGDWVEIAEPIEAKRQSLFLSEAGLSFTPPDTPQNYEMPFDLRHGQCAGDTGYFGRVGGLPLEQTPDDERALTFDSVPLEHALCILGHVLLDVLVTTERFPAQLACRLCDVAPDGRSNLIARTVVALELDDDLDHPRDSTPGEAMRVRIKFPTTAYKVDVGHRLRLSLGSSYWPLVWPVGRSTRTKISTHGAELRLPLRSATANALTTPFPAARDLPEVKRWQISANGPLNRRYSTESEGTFSSGWHQPEVTIDLHDIDVRFAYETTADFTCGETPDTAECTVKHRIEVTRPDGTATIASKVTLTNTLDGPDSSALISVTWNGETVAQLESYNTCRGDDPVFG